MEKIKIDNKQQQTIEKQKVFYKCVFDTKTDNGWYCVTSDNHAFYLQYIQIAKKKSDFV